MDLSLIQIDLAFWTTIVAISLLLVLSAFFSGSETALTAASRGKLRAQADKGSHGAAQALLITDDNERLIGSVLLGNNLVNILATSLATALFTKFFGESGVALATLVMTLLVLVFAEVLPKTYAITNAEIAAAKTAPVIQLVILVFDRYLQHLKTALTSTPTPNPRTDPSHQFLGLHCTGFVVLEEEDFGDFSAAYRRDDDSPRGRRSRSRSRERTRRSSFD